MIKNRKTNDRSIHKLWEHLYDIFNFPGFVWNQKVFIRVTMFKNGLSIIDIGFYWEFFNILIQGIGLAFVLKLIQIIYLPGSCSPSAPPPPLLGYGIHQYRASGFVVWQSGMRVFLAPDISCIHPYLLSFLTSYIPPPDPDGATTQATGSTGWQRITLNLLDST